MEVETKQLCFFIILTALSLKINASPAQIDPPPMNTTLGSDREDSVNNSPNIEFTTRGKKYLVLKTIIILGFVDLAN